jgi:hypothetical protein
MENVSNDKRLEKHSAQNAHSIHRLLLPCGFPSLKHKPLSWPRIKLG